MIKRIVLLSSLVAFSIMVQAQKTITNTLTPEHRVVPGSKLRLVVPEGFEFGQDFVGFVHPVSQANLLIAEQPIAFEKIDANLNEEALLARGVVLQNKEPLRINGFKATLITGRQVGNGANLIKYILVFGSASSSTLLSASVPADQPEMAQSVLNSMLGVLPAGR